MPWHAAQTLLFPLPAVRFACVVALLLCAALGASQAGAADRSETFKEGASGDAVCIYQADRDRERKRLTVGYTPDGPISLQARLDMNRDRYPHSPYGVSGASAWSASADLGYDRISRQVQRLAGGQAQTLPRRCHRAGARSLCDHRGRRRAGRAKSRRGIAGFDSAFGQRHGCGALCRRSPQQHWFELLLSPAQQRRLGLPTGE